jgi:succinate dehydrogenase / fumarate reductase, iron-sulfur subunit
LLPERIFFVDVTLRVRRFDPDKDKKPYWGTYILKNCEPTNRILELLHRVKWEQDGTLTLRRSCAQGICGSDAMRINGRNRLACKVLIQEFGENPKVQIEPILGMKVIKDMVVDMEAFFAHYRAVMPYMVNDTPAPKNAEGELRERIQTPEARAVFDDTTKCILCAACTTSCPSYWANGDYVGPAAIVQAHRFIFDDRDQAAQERLDVLADPDGVWSCRTIYNCTTACPRGIEVTRAIGEVKQAITRGGRG